MGCHQRSPPYSATTWTDATLMAIALSGTAPYVFVKVRSLPSAALALLMHWLWCSLKVRCTSIQTPSQCVACSLNHTYPFPTLLFDLSFSWSCFRCPVQRVHSTIFNFSVLKFSPRHLAHSMVIAAVTQVYSLTNLT
jgi:hypothetical protein